MLFVHILPVLKIIFRLDVLHSLVDFMQDFNENKTYRKTIQVLSILL